MVCSSYMTWILRATAYTKLLHSILTSVGQQLVEMEKCQKPCLPHNLHVPLQAAFIPWETLLPGRRLSNSLERAPRSLCIAGCGIQSGERRIQQLHGCSHVSPGNSLQLSK